MVITNKNIWSANNFNDMPVTWIIHSIHKRMVRFQYWKLLKPHHYFVYTLYLYFRRNHKSTTTKFSLNLHQWCPCWLFTADVTQLIHLTSSMLCTCARQLSIWSITVLLWKSESNTLRPTICHIEDNYTLRFNSRRYMSRYNKIWRIISIKFTWTIFKNTVPTSQQTYCSLIIEIIPLMLFRRQTLYV